MLHWRRSILILIIVQFLSSASYSLVFPFLPLYIEKIGIATYGSIEFWSGLVISSQAITMMVSAPIWGIIADRYGRKPMLLRATIAGALMLILMGFVQNAEQLTILRTIQGLLTGSVAATNALAAVIVPKENSGEVMGKLQMANWIGVVGGPLVGGLLSDLFGFRTCFFITGIGLAISAFIVLFWIQEDFEAKIGKRKRRFFDEYFTLLQERRLSGLYFLSFLSNLGRTAILPIAPLFILSLLKDRTIVATVTGVMIGTRSFTGIIGARWLGGLGDSIGHSRILVVTSSISLLFFLPQPFVTTAWQLVLLQALTGFATGGLLPSLAALMNLWAPEDSQGKIYGLDSSVGSLARSVSPMIASAIVFLF